MTWIIIWLACGFGSAIIAEQKNRSGCGWFVLGFLFGPIGFVISLIMSKVDPTPVKISKPYWERERTCPFCAEDIKAEAIVCKHCGRDLPPTSQNDEKPDTFTSTHE